MNCDINALINEARCFSCISPGLQMSIKTALACRLSNLAQIVGGCGAVTDCIWITGAGTMGVNGVYSKVSDDLYRQASGFYISFERGPQNNIIGGTIFDSVDQNYYVSDGLAPCTWQLGHDGAAPAPRGQYIPCPGLPDLAPILADPTKIFFVEAAPLGNDGAAVKGDPAHPWEHPEVAAALAVAGETVLMGTGVITSNAAIVMPAGTRLVGRGYNQTILRCTATFPGTAMYPCIMPQDNCIIEGFSLANAVPTSLQAPIGARWDSGLPSVPAPAWFQPFNNVLVRDCILNCSIDNLYLVGYTPLGNPLTTFSITYERCICVTGWDMFTFSNDSPAPSDKVDYTLNLIDTTCILDESTDQLLGAHPAVYPMLYATPIDVRFLFDAGDDVMHVNITRGFILSDVFRITSANNNKSNMAGGFPDPSTPFHLTGPWIILDRPYNPATAYEQLSVPTCSGDYYQGPARTHIVL